MTDTVRVTREELNLNDIDALLTHMKERGSSVELIWGEDVAV